MLETFKDLTAKQFEAVLCTLSGCVDACPDGSWDSPVANHKFCQVVFHTLFFTDYYLGPGKGAFRSQPFHRDNPQFFRDYEELEDRKPELLYDKASIKGYLEHVCGKTSRVINAETPETLKAHCGFERLTLSRAELYVYIIRHIQHHAAQLIMRLRIDGSADIPWFKSGWPEA